MQILYEDKHITVCLKPVGASSEDSGTDSVPQLLREHWGQEKAYVGIIHRLDTGVGGVMVYARTQAAAASLSAQVQDRKFVKEYRCVCAGVPEPPAGSMQDYLFKDSRQGKVFPVKGSRKGAKEALLDYEVLTSFETADGVQASLCRVLLHTGRTHQVRVQFASRRHPLLGDGKYGSRIKGSIRLQCARLAFAHPATKEPMEFCAPLPEEWEELICASSTEQKH